MTGVSSCTRLFDQVQHERALVAWKLDPAGKQALEFRNQVAQVRIGRAIAREDLAGY